MIYTVRLSRMRQSYDRPTTQIHVNQTHILLMTVVYVTKKVVGIGNVE